MGTETLEFDWDEANISHIARHGIAPGKIESALGHDPIDIGYEVVGDEERWTSLGHTEELRVLKVVWTMRGRAVRPVTAVVAPRRDRVRYLRFRGLIE